jgi:hypothetical protein
VEALNELIDNELIDSSFTARETPFGFVQGRLSLRLKSGSAKMTPFDRAASLQNQQHLHLPRFTGCFGNQFADYCCDIYPCRDRLYFVAHATVCCGVV